MDQPPAPAVTTAPIAPAPERRLRRGLWQRYVVDTRRDTDAASAAYRATTDARTADRKMIAEFMRDGLTEQQARVMLTKVHRIEPYRRMLKKLT